MVTFRIKERAFLRMLNVMCEGRGQITTKQDVKLDFGQKFKIISDRADCVVPIVGTVVAKWAERRDGGRVYCYLFE